MGLEDPVVRKLLPRDKPGLSHKTGKDSMASLESLPENLKFSVQSSRLGRFRMIMKAQALDQDCE